LNGGDGVVEFEESALDAGTIEEAVNGPVEEAVEVIGIFKHSLTDSFFAFSKIGSPFLVSRWNSSSI
jgi:hypothetical protein